MRGVSLATFAVMGADVCVTDVCQSDEDANWLDKLQSFPPKVIVEVTRQHLICSHLLIMAVGGGGLWGWGIAAWRYEETTEPAPQPHLRSTNLPLPSFILEMGK